MYTKKYFDKIVLIVFAIGLVIALFWKTTPVMGYEKLLFDDSYVHQINLQVDDVAALWEKEEYVMADIKIDEETIAGVGLRIKGNNSLSLSKEYGLSRYSYKIEFDHYEDGVTYHGLDKLTLDASFQDNSYLKTKLAYDLYQRMGVLSSLCSFAWVTINQEPIGLYVVIEEIEDGFLKRQYGNSHGQLYKPDYKRLEYDNRDIGLCYLGEMSTSYPGIFDHAKTNADPEDKKNLIESIRQLNLNKNLEQYIDVDHTLRYFVVLVFTMNWDSYIGPTGHNYYLYEEQGKIQILPWDQNLGFGTYCFEMTDPIQDNTYLINFPILTPWYENVLENRPLFTNLVESYQDEYLDLFDTFLTQNIDSQWLKTWFLKESSMIAPYVKKDPSAYVSFEEHELAVSTLYQLCVDRSKSIRSQLEGSSAITLNDLEENPKQIETSVNIPDLGNLQDLENAYDKNQILKEKLLSTSPKD